MCKVLCIAGLNPDNSKNNWKFIIKMGMLMSKGGNGDGLGYTAVDEDGNIFGEHWLYNGEAFSVRSNDVPKPDNDKALSLASKFMGFLTPELEKEEEPVDRYKTWGKITDRIVAITLHTRLATTGAKVIMNVHPFVDEERSISIIHNGGIRNHEKADEIRSTCDSERILNKYIEHEINTVPEDMQNMVDELKGYMTCGALARDAEGNRILDVWTTNAFRLEAATVKELNALVFSTDYSDIKEACKDVKFKLGNKFKPKAEQLCRLDAITGKFLKKVEFKDTMNGWVAPTNSYPNNSHYNRSPYNGYDKYWNHETGTYNYEDKTKTRRETVTERFKEQRTLEQKVADKESEIAKLAKEQMNEARMTSTELVNKAIEEIKSEKTMVSEADWQKEKKTALALVPTQAELEEARSITKRYDLMNEKEAMLDGYTFEEESGMWLLNKKIVH